MLSKRISWWFIALSPIIGFLMIEAWLLADGYDGHCGLLDAGWVCSKTEYIWYSLFNPLVVPILFIYSVGWLMFVGIIATVVRIFRGRQRNAT